MADIVLIAPIETIKGKLNKKDKTVMRRKRIYDEQGRVISELAQEAYVVQNPRDWKKNPPKGAEKERLDNWTNACRQAKSISKDPEQLAMWKQRWQKQLTHPEPDAPIDPKTHRPKVYIRLDCYIRATIFRQLATNNQPKA